MAFFDNTRLPDPDWGMDDKGEGSSSHTKGPGFASVKLSSAQPLMRDRTNSGKLVTRSQLYHKWNISITYNPMTKAQFAPIYSFLLSKQVSGQPFFVALPQYKLDTSTGFGGQVNEENIRVTSNQSKGANQFSIRNNLDNDLTPGSEIYYDFMDLPPPGQVLFNLPTTLSWKTFMINFSEIELQSGTTPDGIKLHITPALNVDLTTTDFLNFTNQLFRVVQTGTTYEYDLGTNGLYQFGLKLEEAL
jgi:hypothetical protein